MRCRIRHLTEYSYTEPVSLSHHRAHLVPRQDNGQVTASRELRISPTPALRREHLDAFANRATYFSIEEPHSRLEVELTCEVNVPPIPRPALATPTSWETVRDRVRHERRADVLDAYLHTFRSPGVDLGAPFAEYAAPSFLPGRPYLEAVMDLNHRIHGDFVYDPRATNVSTRVAEVLAARRGVCQDFAHFALAALRSLGLPARYVSGYILTHPPPGRPRLAGADACHAWVQVYLPDFGWIDFDPTNDLMPSDEHITLAYGRDFGDVTPVRGVILGGGPHELKVQVDVVPL